MGGTRERTLARLLLVVLVITVCVSIGTPLVGLRVFFATDILQTLPPWSQNAPPGFAPTNPRLRDPVSAVMPVLAEFRRGVLSGHFPLWSTDPSGGVPLGTLPYNGLLSVLNLPYLLLPMWYAPAISKLLEMGVAAGFTFLFLRRIGLGKAASLVGGLIYVNSGFQVVWTTFPQSEVGALIPALFWAVEVALDRKSPRGVIPLAVAAALILLQGFPALAVFALLASGLYVLARIVASPHSTRARLRTLALVGGALVLGVGIASIQFLPFAAQARALDLSYRTQTARTHIPTRALITLAIPEAFGSPVDRNYFGTLHFTRTGYGPATYHEIESFIGATPLALIAFGAAAGLVRRRRARELAPGASSFLWGGSVFTAVLIYVGGPLLAVLQTFALFRLNYIGRLRALFLFFLSALAAVGFHALVHDRRRDERRSWPIGLVVVVAAALLASIGLWLAWQLAGEVDQRRYLLTHSILPLFALGVTVIGVAFRKRLKLGGLPAVAWVVPILIAAESLAFAVPYWPRTSRASFYPTTSAHRFLDRHLGGDRLGAANFVLFPGTTTYYGLRSVTAHTFEQSTWGDLLQAANGGRLGRIVYPRLRSSPAVATSPIFDRLSVRYFVTGPTRVFGREVDASPPAGTVVLRAGSEVTQEIANRRIRGVAVSLRAPFRGSDQHAVLTARVIGPSGAELTRGSRSVVNARARTFVIPLREYEVPRTGRSVQVRLSLQATSGQVVLGADQHAGPSVSLIVPEDGLDLVFTDGVLIYRRPSSLPRIRWAPYSIVVADAKDRVKALADGLPSDTVALSRPGPEGSGQGAVLRVPQGSGDQMRVVVDARGAGYLVVADAIQSGWRAWVDGRPADLVQADHALGAVFVPAGRHEVTLRYQPAAWRLGELTAGLSVLVLLALAAVGRRRG